MHFDGIVNFRKPAGLTSHDAVAFLRRLTGVKKIGHTGTLDPMATGVLPLCVGKATRIVEYLASDEKAYRCEMRLGVETDTQDIWGTVVGGAEGDFLRRLSQAQVLDTIQTFQGEQMQTPPAYSAVKVNGRRLYAYARAGETVQAPARKIYIKEITVESIDLEAGSVVFQVTCSKGSYIRALCADIGKALGCGAVMSGLLRTASGCFTLAASHTAETLTRVFSSASGAPDAGGDLPEAVRAVCVRMDEALGVFAPLCLPEADCVRFVNGLPVRAPALFSASAATAAPAETAASAETPVPAKTAASAETPARSVPGAAYGPAEKCKDRYRVYGAPGGLHAGFLGIGKREDALLRAEKVLWGQDGLL